MRNALPMWLAILTLVLTACSIQYERSSRVSGNTPDWYPQMQRGIGYVTSGRYRLGLLELLSARETLQREKDLFNEAVAVGLIGDTYAALGQPERARTYYEDAAEFARQIGAKDNYAVLLQKIGNTHFLMRNNEAAAKQYLEAHEVLRGTTYYAAAAPTLFANMGSVLVAEGHNEDAIEAYDRALGSALLDSGARAGVIAAKGNVYQEQKNYDLALATYEDALVRARRLPIPTWSLLPLVGIGSVYLAQERYDEALVVFEEAIEIQEAVVSAGEPEVFRLSAPTVSGPAYIGAVTAAVHQGEIEKAFLYSERSRARIFIDQLGATRTNNRTAFELSRVESLNWQLLELQRDLQREEAREGDDRARSLREEISSLERSRDSSRENLGDDVAASSLSSVAVASLADLQATLPDGTTLISYFVSVDETFAFIVDNSSLNVVVLDAGYLEIQDMVSRLDQLAGSSARGITAANNAVGPPLRQSLTDLYGKLFAPLESGVAEGNLIIVPHRALNYLSFASLTDGDGYLADRFTISYLPAASVRVHLKPSLHIGGQILVMSQAEVEGFDRLDHADAEAQAIADLYGVEAILGPQATESAFVDRATGADIIHIAAHGELNPVKPLFSRILLGRDRRADGSLEVHEIYSMRLESVELIVLSACDSQMGKLSAGEDVVGLSRAFLSAGADSVIASLWPVDDAATSALMIEFYRQLRSGQSKTAALAAAQRYVREQYPHPYFWAAFTLSGDPGVGGH